MAYARAAHLADASLGTELDESLMGDAEKALSQAVRASRASISEALEAKRLDDVIGQLASLREPIDAFFADVMVMDEDVALRENRLRLLNNLVEVFSGIANVGELGRKK